jgi:hypothetical protein
MSFDLNPPPWEEAPAGFNRSGVYSGYFFLGARAPFHPARR